MSLRERYMRFPFRLAPEGGFSTSDADEHIRQRIEQILFTTPGERVMLPEFGCAVRDLVFAGNNEVIAAAAEFTIAKSLHTYLGDQIMVNAVDVVSEEEKLHIHVIYTRTRDLEQEKVVFQLSPFEGVRRG